MNSLDLPAADCRGGIEMGVSVMPEKLNMEEAAQFLGVTYKTLSRWLSEGKGPRNYKYLKRVWFDMKDLEAFKKSLVEVRAS